MFLTRSHSAEERVDWLVALREIFGLERVGVEYQPLIHAQTGEAIGYEALARFRDRAGALIENHKVFQVLHELSRRTFFDAERDLKRMQICNAPGTGQLFLNFDPCCIGAEDLTDIPRLIDGMFLGRHDIVVEIVENTKLADLGFVEATTRELSRNEILVALDDIGAPKTALFLAQVKMAHFLKFDRYWLSDQVANDPFLPREFLFAMIAYAKSTGKKTVLEGVETSEHLDFALDAGFDLVQGFRYRDRFLRKEQSIREWPEIFGRTIAFTASSEGYVQQTPFD